MQIDRAASG